MSLRKYEIEAMVAAELMKEQSESFDQKKVLDETKNRILKEEEATSTPVEYDPNRGLSDKCIKTRQLTQLIQSLIWRMQDSYFGDEVGDDIKQLIDSSSYAAIGAAVSKLYHLWNSEKDEISADPQEGGEEEVVVGDEVKSNAGDAYKIESIVEDMVSIVNKKGEKKTATLDIVKKWKKNNK